MFMSRTHAQRYTRMHSYKQEHILAYAWSFYIILKKFMSRMWWTTGSESITSHGSWCVCEYVVMRESKSSSRENASHHGLLAPCVLSGPATVLLVFCRRSACLLLRPWSCFDDDCALPETVLITCFDLIHAPLVRLRPCSIEYWDLIDTLLWPCW